MFMKGNVIFVAKISTLQSRIIITAFIILIILFTFFLFYRANNSYVESQIYSMNTIMEMKIWGRGAKEVADEISSLVNQLNTLFDDYSPYSEVSRINSNAGIQPIEVSKDTLQIVNLSKDYYNLTKGKFNIMMGAVSQLWGFKDNSYRIPTEEEIKEVENFINIDDIVISQNTIYLRKKGERIDLGGIAKGYTLDKISNILEKSHISSALINFGGSVLTYGDREWKVGIKNPRGDGIIGILSVKGNSFISTSGDYERFFIENGKRYCHIFDPDTCKPPAMAVSATVIGKNGVETDVYSTAFFILGKASEEIADNVGVKLVGFDSNLDIFGNSGGLSIFEKR